ncbi:MULTISPECIES: glycosyltransferase [Acinetobacter]|uniref:Glycosyltransferase n=1 Tax=Acinetobacter pittii TaxID=48296 RepID=A0A1H8PHR8_ACIPI|nr:MULTISPECIES: glycosyltransferase [Acinetobacter]MDR0070404.1 glycosyltransferase [Acinetobacter sp. 11520]AVZ03678.1 glycosyltransferase [Acinetobacter pittii]AZP28128.1 glycosyl transferase [Acinetobacter pittii]EXC29681.1 glycosyl transferase 2 family protein [Acinetobacter sp. 809848]EXE27047.1 glycosyl transferase 2 family protein [Acinetobacter sp. 907131]
MFVSIIVPSYNHAQYLEERINSILNQSYSQFELILLDDLSPDHSAKILEKYRKHPKVSHCIINEKNSGSTFYQWNKGMHLAKGELIWIAESDDIADPRFLEKLVPQFEKNHNLVLAYSQSYRMNAKGEITGSWKDFTDQVDPKLFENNFEMKGLEYIEKFLNTQNTIPNASGVIFKKQTYFDVGGANPSLRFIGDWEIWAKIVTQGDIFFTHECLNYFRYHNTSVIAQAKKKKDHFEVRRQVILFRQSMSQFLKAYSHQHPEANKAYQINQRCLSKELRKNASLAIRRRYYNRIMPTCITALETLPFYIVPIYILKLLIQLILSICFVAPYKALLKQTK